MTGWTQPVPGGGIVSTAIQGTKAFQTRGDINGGYGNSTTVSGTFTITAGIKFFSAQIYGGGDYNTMYVSLVNAATGVEIARLAHTGVASVWQLCDARFSLSSDVSAYIKIVDSFYGNANGGFIVDDLQINSQTTGQGNLDFEQGLNGWLVLGYGAQVASFMSNPYVGPAQGTLAYQSATGTGVMSDGQQACTNEAYSSIFTVPAGIQIFSADLYGTNDQTLYVALMDANGGELCRLQRFGSGLNWERCYATISLSGNTDVYVKIVDRSTSAHLGVDDITVTPCGPFTNFDFEQGWIGWMHYGNSGYIIPSTIQGTKAYETRGDVVFGYGNSTLVSAPFTIPAGTYPFGAEMYGGGWGSLYISLVEAASGREIGHLNRGSSGTSWIFVSTSVTVSQPTLAYLKIVDAFDGNNIGGIIVDDIRIPTITPPSGGGTTDPATQIAALQQQVQSLTMQVSQLQDSNASLLSQLTAAQASNATLQGQVTTLTSANQSLQDQLTAANQQIAQLNSSLQAAQTANQSLQSQNTTLQSQLSDAQSTITNLRGQVATLTSANQSLQSQLNQANTQVATLMAQNAQLSSANQTLQSQLSAANAQIAQLTSDLQAAQAANQALQAQNSALQSQLDAANTQIVTLTAQNAQLSSANQTLTTQNNAMVAQVQALNQFFSTLFNNPTFQLPGSTPQQQLQNLVTAVQQLNHGQQQALYKNLGG